MSISSIICNYCYSEPLVNNILNITVSGFFGESGTPNYSEITRESSIAVQEVDAVWHYLQANILRLTLKDFLFKTVDKTNLLITKDGSIFIFTNKELGSGCEKKVMLAVEFFTGRHFVEIKAAQFILAAEWSVSLRAKNVEGILQMHYLTTTSIIADKFSMNLKQFLEKKSFISLADFRLIAGKLLQTAQQLSGNRIEINDMYDKNILVRLDQNKLVDCVFCDFSLWAIYSDSITCPVQDKWVKGALYTVLSVAFNKINEKERPTKIFPFIQLLFELKSWSIILESFKKSSI